MESNKERQQNELLLLQAVYPDLLEQIDEDHFKIRLSNTFDESPMVLTIQYVDGYPSECPPSFKLYAEWLSDDAISKYTSHMIDLYNENDRDVIVYIWVNYLQEEITSEAFLNERKERRLGTPYTKIQKEINNDIDSKSYEYIEEESIEDTNTLFDTNLNLNTIYSSEDFVDRKSVFRSHCAEVHSVAEALAVRNKLVSTKPMDKATHNMWAYRIFDSEKNIWYADNDDDGESMAGRKIAHLILEVENVFVMVSRWFGGILLGPDRFKDINNMARKILDDHGYITEKHQKKKK